MNPNQLVVYKKVIMLPIGPYVLGEITLLPRKAPNGEAYVSVGHRNGDRERSIPMISKFEDDAYYLTVDPQMVDSSLLGYHPVPIIKFDIQTEKWIIGDQFSFSGAKKEPVFSAAFQLWLDTH